MKRFTINILFLLSVLLLSAQTQYGYVKTKGRLGADGNVIPGVRLSGATVSIKDRSALISASDGGFSFPLPGKDYIVQSVSKNGYLLTDVEQLRSYGYSSNPLILVMETPEQQNEDRLMAERKINRTLRRTIQQREDELDSLREANRITKEEYDKLYAQLYDDEERNRKLINEMVERYAKMDFDQMDERNREIKACILNGELLKADSLINSKGSLDARIMEYNRLREANAREEEELKKRSETLASSRKFEEKTLLELAEDCFNKSDMFKMGHQNDSVAYYLTIRAELDTTNVQWQLEAGRFLDDYLAAYNKALDYYNRGFRNALMKYGEKSSDVAACYNNIGVIYNSQGNYVKALDYFDKALSIQMSVFGKNHPKVATCYNNLGSIYSSQGDYVKASEYYKKSLSVRLSVYGDNHPDVATCYNNIGLNYYSQGDYVKALEYYNKALSILLSVFGDNHPNVADCYSNLGLNYFSQGDNSQALEYLIKSLNIYSGLYGYNTQKTDFCSKSIYEIYCKLLQQSDEKKKEFEEFISEYSFTIDILEEETPASVQGMSGQYYLLEFGDWNFLSTKSLFEKNIELQGKPKDIVVMKDGVIAKHHFEDKIGCQISLKYVGKEDKQRIVESYKKWKNK